MSRPWRMWLVFGLGLAAVLAATGWTSVKAVQLDRAEAEARRQAAFEENVRLALWRMDSSLTWLLARENSRPYFVYSSFYPAERAYNRMFARIRKGEVLVPSPLLTEAPPEVLLHFQFLPDGTLTSPQAPEGNMRDLAESGYARAGGIEAAEKRLAELRSFLSRDAIVAALRRRGADSAERTARSGPDRVATAPRQVPSQQAEQAARAVQEWEARSLNVKKQLMRLLEEQRVVRDEGKSEDASRPGGHLMTPLWIDGRLFLVRRVSEGGGGYVQGCWLDWPELKRELLARVVDLLPGADLEPVDSADGAGGSRTLAALPVRVLPGEAPALADDSLSPIRVSLAIAWACVLLGAVAVVGLLRSAMSLSERRGAFVSAVTHELRTPLTTFRMYTEMLAEGMIRDEAKVRRYLDTLHREAERLGRLVENVLAYARLESGRDATRGEAVAVGDLLERVAPELHRRAERAGMTVSLHVGESDAATLVRTDVSAVGQILFNLVDNACKYAASAENKEIRITAERTGDFVTVRVRDHGPGVSGAEVKRLFKPFCKSAGETTPGVGLGLALSRRLARRMGGDLRLDGTVGGRGACFALTLPVA